MEIKAVYTTTSLSRGSNADGQGQAAVILALYQRFTEFH